MLLISEFEDLRDNVLFSFNFWQELGRNCFPGFHDTSPCKVFNWVTGKSVILSKVTSDIFSKVILHLKMQISVAAEGMLI